MDNISDHRDMSEKAVLAFLFKWSVKLVSPVLFGGLVHYIVAPYSFDIGMMLYEPIAIGYSLAILLAAFIFLKLVAKISFFRNFVLALLGLIIMLYVYPPNARTQEPNKEIESQIINFMEHEKGLIVVDIKIRPRHKGYFDHFSSKNWVADISFSNNEKSLIYVISQSLDGELELEYSPTPKPSIATFKLDSK